MNLQLLIDSIVRQTTVLIAQLATLHNVRAPLAHVANQVFLDLANELFAQGVSRKVSADMFGMALRTYLRRIQRLSESSTMRGQSLWEAVLQYLGEREIVTRAEVFSRFHRDESELVRGVLHDLCESGLVFRTGSGPGTAYRVARPEELQRLAASENESGLDEMIWAMIYREGPLTLEDLSKRVPGKRLEGALARLVERGRVQRTEQDGVVQFTSSTFYVPRNSGIGWEAAVFDHFQAVVKTIVAKLSSGGGQNEHIGGSTYSLQVWSGHPFEREVLDQLKEFRDKVSALRARVRAYNEAHAKPPEVLNVTIYAGQCIVPEREEAPDHAEPAATEDR